MLDLKQTFLAKFPMADERALDIYLLFLDTCPPPEGYHEKHHILPKSLFPEFRLASEHPWNQLKVSAGDHFKAHYLLWRVLPEDHRLVCAWKQMKCKRIHLIPLKLLAQFAEEYEQAKKVHSDYMRTRPCTKETRGKMSASAKVKVFSEEHKRRMSEAKVGHKHSEETKQKIRDSNKGQTRTEEARKRMSEAQRASSYTPTPEHLQRLAEASRGRTHSEDAKRKISEANKGKQRTEEFKQRMSELAKGRTHSEETRRKIGDIVRGRVRGPMSEETKRKISEAKRKKATP